MGKTVNCVKITLLSCNIFLDAQNFANDGMNAAKDSNQQTNITYYFSIQA